MKIQFNEFKYIIILLSIFRTTNVCFKFPGMQYFQIIPDLSYFWDCKDATDASGSELAPNLSS